MSAVNVEVIERLREAAKEHGEVADLLDVLATSFPFFGDGNTEFCGADLERQYFETVLIAAQFTKYDKENPGG